MTPAAPPDWRALLLPIDAAAVAGHDLRNTSDPLSIYWPTRELRDEARQLERDCVPGRDRHARLQQLWQQVAANTHDILSRHSKDFDVVAWLIEAWSRLYGIQGLAGGLQLFASMLREFWLQAFPDSKHCEYAADRVSAFAGLNGDTRPGTLIDAIHGMAVTAATDGDDFALWHVCTARAVAAIADETQRQQRIESLGFALADIHHAAHRTPAAFYREAGGALRGALDAMHDIDRALDALLGDSAPSTAQIHAALASLGDALTTLAPADDAPPQPIGCPVPALALPLPDLAHRQDSAISTDAVNVTRCDAIVQLERIARYFRHAEPHSPLSYGIDKLILWARLPLPELMRELITDAAARSQFHLMTGIRLEDPP